SFLYVVRWLLFSIVDHSLTIIAIQVLHGLTFAIFYLSALDFISRLIPDKLKSTGHLIFYSVFFGVSGIVGSLGGGYIIELFNGSTLYMISSVLALIGAFSLVLYKRFTRTSLV